MGPYLHTSSPVFAETSMQHPRILDCRPSRQILAPVSRSTALRFRVQGLGFWGLWTLIVCNSAFSPSRTQRIAGAESPTMLSCATFTQPQGLEPANRTEHDSQERTWYLHLLSSKYPPLRGGSGFVQGALRPIASLGLRFEGLRFGV